MNFKDLTIAELKKDYINRHGFIFVGSYPPLKESCDRLCAALINVHITDVMAEFVVILNPNTYVFVYPEGVSFDSPAFYAKAQATSRMMGLWQVDTLTGFLQTQ